MREPITSDWSAERGSTLPLLLLLSIVILVFAGLAIDSAFLTTSKTQQRQLAEYVALESLHTYLQTPGTKLDKVAAVRDRAKEIAKLNVLLGNRISGLSSGPNDVGTSTNTLPSSAADGTLYPGIWWYREPTTAEPFEDCPPYSGTLGSWSEQFFQRVDLDNYPDCKINAFEVKLHFRGASGIRTTFMRAFGVDVRNESSAEAVAATYPRRGVFLVDLSRSSHAETHRPYEGSGGSQQAEYFKLSSEFTFRSSVPCDDTNSAGNNIPDACLPPNTACNIYGGSTRGLYHALWYSYRNPLDSSEPILFGGYNFIGFGTRPIDAPPYLHYRNEYFCYDISYTDTRLGTTAVTETYFVDMRTAPPDYVGPEPLSSMLRGVNYAFKTMEGNSVDGDKLGIIGFDESATISQRTFPLAAPKEPEWLTATNITDVDANPRCLSDPTVSAAVCRVRDHFFITRERGNANIAEAIQEGHRLLKNAASEQPAENFLMLLSDGVGNCDLGRRCGLTDADYAASYTDITNVVSTLLQPDDIQLHILTFGELTGAHTLVVPSPNQVDSNGNSTACLSEEEARDFSPPLLLTDSTSGSATLPIGNINNSGGGLWGSRDSWGNPVKLQQSRFFRPNSLFEFTRDTGGRWFPTRPPCSGNANQALKNACTGKKFSQTSGKPSPVTDAILVGTQRINDAYGRLLCDPDALTREEQVRQAMNVIVGRSPYIIVR